MHIFPWRNIICDWIPVKMLSFDVRVGFTAALTWWRNDDVGHSSFIWNSDGPLWDADLFIHIGMSHVKQCTSLSLPAVLLQHFPNVNSRLELGEDLLLLLIEKTQLRWFEHRVRMPLGLCIFSSLGMLQGPPGGPGQCPWRKECLFLSWNCCICNPTTDKG